MSRQLWAAMIVAAMLATPALAAVSVSPLFGDHMVLQRDRAVRVWGQADAGEQVTVAIAGQQHSATADGDGNWQVMLEPLPAGGPHTLQVGEKTFSDVLVGDVWIAGGQSNMAFQLKAASTGKADAAKANLPQLRLLTVGQNVSLSAVDELTKAEWKVCSPATASSFSAVAFYFGRELLTETSVPQGLISSNRGATKIEPWMSEASLRKFEEHTDLDLAAVLEQYAIDHDTYIRIVNAWREKLDAADAGLAGDWARPDLDDGDWAAMKLPTHWEKAGLEGLDGSVWFRRTIDLPEDFSTKCIMLRLGSTDDFCDVYFNGRKIHANGPEESGAWKQWRLAYVPADALNLGGTNTIAVRVTDVGGQGGGIWRAAGWHAIFLTDCAGQTFRLEGEWKYRVGADAAKVASLPTVPPMPPDITEPNRESVLFNGMIHPLRKFAARGFLWYQGESNAWTNGIRYRDLLAGMIADWRGLWGDADMPFLIVQLPGWKDAPDQPEPHAAWADLRESQLAAHQATPLTGLAVTLDLGDAVDIHPTDKAPVGRRLALWALKLVYGQDVQASGPVYRSMAVRDGAVWLTFFNPGGAMKTTDGGPLKQFQIAGADGQFVWAQARIEGDRVVVWSEEVSAPTAVRYAWAMNPEGANLANEAGLLASPFRTDSPEGR